MTVSSVQAMSKLRRSRMMLTIVLTMMITFCVGRAMERIASRAVTPLWCLMQVRRSSLMMTGVWGLQSKIINRRAALESRNTRNTRTSMMSSLLRLSDAHVPTMLDSRAFLVMQRESRGRIQRIQARDRGTSHLLAGLRSDAW